MITYFQKRPLNFPFLSLLLSAALLACLLVPLFKTQFNLAKKQLKNEGQSEVANWHTCNNQSRHHTCNNQSSTTPDKDEYFFKKNGPPLASFSFIFGLFQPNIKILQQIHVKNVHTVLGFKLTTYRT